MFDPLVFPDYESLSQHVAEALAQRLRVLPDALFCLAAGMTPLRAYQLFAARCLEQQGLSDQLRVIQLDEWGGLAKDDRATCAQCLRTTLADPLRLHDRYLGFESSPPDPAAECARVADWLSRHGPIDACVLGLGVNGHIGFNEPAAELQPHAHVAELSAASLRHATLAATRGRPGYGMTLGMADLMHAREVLLLVSGAAKREPLRRLLWGAITTHFPASLLVLHPHLRLICDAAAMDD